MYTRIEDPVSKKFLGVRRDSDGASIPADLDNFDYQEFLAWNVTAAPPVVVTDGVLTMDEKKFAKGTQLSTETRQYVEQHYEPHRQQTFTFLYASGGTNRKAYIQAVWSWIDSIFTHYYSKLANIQSASNQAALDAVTWDLSSFDGTDPAGTIEVARSIAD